MKTTSRSRGLRAKVSVLLFATVAGLVVSAAAIGLSRPTPAEAHCDSVNGPVVNAARQALDNNNVDLVLPYVQAESEAELTRVFEHTQEVRKLGGEAQQLADHFFFETAVRLHRTGEGATYTGLKMESDFGPALTEADRALESGSLDGVQSLLEQEVKDGISQKYQVVVDAREAAAKEGTVAANRERAEAELLFEKYVYGLYETASGASVAGEGSQTSQTTASHSH